MRSMMVKILLIYLMSGCDKANGRCRSAKGTCPSDWNQWGDNCYKVIEPDRSWSRVRDECVRIGGIMAAPNSLEENTYIRSLDSRNIWINCNDLETEGKLQHCQFKSYNHVYKSIFCLSQLNTFCNLTVNLRVITGFMDVGIWNWYETLVSSPINLYQNIWK